MDGMKKFVFLLGLCFVAHISLYAQMYFDEKGNIVGTPYDSSQDAQFQDMLNRMNQGFDDAAAQRRELQRIEAEQAIERQRLQNEQYAQQEQIRIQREQAEAASMRNWQVSVYGTTLWKDGEPAGLKDREEKFTVTATDAQKAEAKA